jgi:hypothetical protein
MGAKRPAVAAELQSGFLNEQAGCGRQGGIRSMVDIYRATVSRRMAAFFQCISLKT